MHVCELRNKVAHPIKKSINDNPVGIVRLRKVASLNHGLMETPATFVLRTCKQKRIWHRIIAAGNRQQQIPIPRDIAARTVANG